METTALETISEACKSNNPLPGLGTFILRKKSWPRDVAIRLKKDNNVLMAIEDLAIRIEDANAGKPWPWKPGTTIRVPNLVPLTDAEMNIQKGLRKNAGKREMPVDLNRPLEEYASPTKKMKGGLHGTNVSHFVLTGPPRVRKKERANLRILLYNTWS